MLRYLWRKLSDFIIKHYILYSLTNLKQRNTALFSNNSIQTWTPCYNLYMLCPLIPMSNHYPCTCQHWTNDTVLIFVNKKAIKYMRLRKMYCDIVCFGQGGLGEVGHTADRCRTWAHRHADTELYKSRECNVRLLLSIIKFLLAIVYLTC